MAYFMFVDESGQDRGESPYEVLAGIAIEDRNLWPLVLDLRRAEEHIFGRRYSEISEEYKARKILKKKTFRLASARPEFPADERRELARSCLDDGASSRIGAIAALSQAKLSFVRALLSICARYECKVFASIIGTNQRQDGRTFLRKDYSYLFERFFISSKTKRASPAG